MRRREVPADRSDGSRDHGCIVSEAEPGQEIGDGIGRQDEIGHGTEQDRPHVRRRLAIQRTDIGGDANLGDSPRASLRQNRSGRGGVRVKETGSRGAAVVMAR